MQLPLHNFNQEAARALQDAKLQRALRNVKSGFIVKRGEARAKLPEFDRLRDEARAIKDHALTHLDLYLQAYEERVVENGGAVHYAATAEDARAIVLQLCRNAGARLVSKSKSMLSEEIELNRHLGASGIEVVETDLGEYIIQLRGDSPSHIIAPVIHLNKEDVAEDFRKAHRLPRDRRLLTAQDLVAEARAVLRAKFLAADVGITGANFLIAETGTSVVVTNEGNADLTQILPRMHIVVASIEKLVPTLEDACTMLRLLARSGTGQEVTTYTTFSTGPRRPYDADGPAAYHVVLIDNGRSDMLGGDFQDMLRCIRCGACLNHCPVYGAIGGHAYGALYPGPMGAVLTPALYGIAHSRDLPHASTFCGRCEEVCPVRIPLPGMMRKWRERDFAGGTAPFGQRLTLRLWAYAAKRPRLYHAMAGLAARVLRMLGGSDGRLRKLPFAGGWTATRDLPSPQGKTFHKLYAARRRKARL